MDTDNSTSIVHNSHGHTHSSCAHTCLHHCKCCDIVYCCGCGREWGTKYWYYQPYPYMPWTYITYTGAVGCGVNYDADTVVQACNHSHS